MENLKTKVVLITGASSGIGEGIAYTFARNGAILSLTGRHKENLDKVAEKCKKEGAAKVISIIGDLAKTEDIERIVEETASKLGQIDVLINNAGVGVRGGVENATIEDFDHVYKINVRAPYYLIQKCVPHLKKTKGCVVNVSSCFSNMTMVLALHYSMGKCALDHLTKSAALELAKYGIRVNGVNPGMTPTPMVDKAFTPEQQPALYKEYSSKTPLGNQLMTVEEIADAVLFLSSSSSRSITGTSLLVDRGRNLVGV